MPRSVGGDQDERAFIVTFYTEWGSKSDSCAERSRP